MERNRLAQLLNGPGYAFSACRHALLEGAEFILWEGSAPAHRMLPAYERREAHTISEGIATLGFPEALVALRAVGAEPVRLGQVTVADPPYLFMIFLAADDAAVVACLGIEQARPSTLVNDMSR